MEKISNKKKIELFTLLLKSRRLEEKLVELFTGGAIAGWVHSALGQEAVGVGIAAHLEQTDYINNTHRGRPIIIGKGVPLKRFMAEVFGKKDGPCKGIAGEMHYCDVEYGIVGFSGIIGANIPIATGIALSCQYRNSGQVIVSCLGDGTSDNGYFHESLNVASKWKLPIVYVVENNRWAQFVPQQVTAAQPDIWRKAEGYNMPGKMVDGTDLLEVYTTSKEAVARARRGEGPTLIECKVNRWIGHYIGDPQKYRTPEDIEEAHKKDPVAILQTKLINEKILTQENIQELEKSINTEIQEAVEFAKNSPAATVEQAFQNVYI